jgi:hypothetical protein
MEKTGSYFNHSVASATLKDYIATLGIYKRKGALPAKIIIEVAPRLFDKKSETDLFSKRWLSNADEYYYFMSFLNYNTPTLIPLYRNLQHKFLKTKALIKYSDSVKNFKLLLSGDKMDYRITNSIFVDDHIKMPDGSLWHPVSRRSKYGFPTRREIGKKLGPMKNYFHQQSLQKMFMDLISYLEKNGTQVIFYLPPYHPYIYQAINQIRALLYFNSHERMIRDLAKSKKIPVIGSYNPQISHLSYKDFHDLVHINDLAMERVFKNYQKVMGKNKYHDKDSRSGFKTVEPTCLEYHWLEAEHAETIVTPLAIANDDNASDGKFIYPPNGTGNQYRSGPIMLTYSVNIFQEGEYILWGRVEATNKRDNSFFVQVDDNMDNLWEVETGASWHWDKINNRDILDPVWLILTPGVHTIKIMLREDGTKLDKLLLTNNVDFVPKGKGDIAEKTGLFGR